MRNDSGERHVPVELLELHGARRAAIAIIVLFFAACLPLAVWQVSTANWDEARYTIAAAEMTATGDYLVPVDPWGETRLLKPPLAYYYVVAGFSLFGQSLFGAKVFWLLSAAAILALTWALARQLGANALAATVAVAALAGNLYFYRAALTHIPDIPQMLGLTLALVGFVRILATPKSVDPPLWALATGWFGIAWAVFAKGLLALVLVAVFLAFRIVRRGVGWPTLAETLVLALSAIVGAWWFVVIAFLKGDLLFQQFLGDQVTRKTLFDLELLLRTFVSNLADLLVGFLPIFIAAIPFSRSRWSGPQRAPVVFLFTWSLVVAVLFSFANAPSERYMLPAMPALAALISLIFNGFSADEIARRAGRAARILAPVVAVIGLLVVGVVYAEESTLAAVLYAVGVAALTYAIWYGAGSRRVGLTLVLLALLPIGAALSTLPAYRYLGQPSAVDLAVDAIDSSGAAPNDVVILGRWHLLERVGLRIPPIQDYGFSLQASPDAISGATVAITTNRVDVPVLVDAGFAVREEIGAPGDYPISALLDAVRARDLEALRRGYGQSLWIGVRTLPSVEDD